MAGHFELSKSSDGQFRFVLKAGNGEIILSSEQYKAKQSALDGIESVRKNAQREGAFEVKAASGGKYHFVLKASNGQVIGTSQLYASEAGAKAGCDSVKSSAPGASVQDDA